MTLHISPAIIMRTWEFGESDLMVSFFTAEEGRLKGVAKGARKSRQRFANCLDLFCLTRLEYERRREEGLFFLHSGRLIDAFPGLRSGFSSLSLASYMIELTEILFPAGVAARRMFELLHAAFSALDAERQIDAFRILFEAKAMALGGYGIDLSRCCVCGRTYQGEGRAVFKQGSGGIACLKCGQESVRWPGLGPVTARALNEIQSTAWDTSQALGLSAEMIRETKPVLKRHIEYRIGQRLKSAEYLDGPV
ncbi:MAG: DNA repair protein RecO [Candidatus Desulfacyla sp.]